MNETDQLDSAPARTNPKRRRALLALAGIFGAAALAYGSYWFLELRHHESTDDAYVAGNIVQITPQTTGTVVAIHADDTDFVKAGAPLVDLDPADAKVALDQAEAALAQTVREVRTLYSTNGSLDAVVAQREADLAKAKDDLARRQALAGTGAVSGEEIEHARTAVKAADAALATAREQLASNKALTEHTTVENHPNVARAAARVREAYLAYHRAGIVAPVSGYVAKRSVQVGMRVAPGQPLMAIVPLDQVWVEANFKEGQLRRMRIGQPVELTADIYGSKVPFSGRVVGLGAGTGAAFALLPAQNATGNWIKIVQRLPVRIAIDPKTLAEHPLRVGLSMEADVNVADQSGAQLASGQRQGPVAVSAAADDDHGAAGALIRRIIAANLPALGQRTAAANVAQEGARKSLERLAASLNALSGVAPR